MAITDMAHDTNSNTNLDVGALRWGYREARAYRARRRNRRIAIVIAIVLLALLAFAAAATQQTAALSCFPDAHPCDAVGDPPPMMPAPPLGACPPGVVIMCPRAALPMVGR